MPTDPEAPFSSFPPVPDEAWRDRVAEDLEGRDVASLDWDTGAGFTLRPFYRASDLDALPHVRDALGVHRTSRSGPRWRLRTPLSGDAPDAFAHDAERAAAGGADVLDVPLGGEAADRLRAVRAAAPGAALFLVPPSEPARALSALRALAPAAVENARVLYDGYAHGLPAPGTLAALHDEAARVAGAPWLTVDLRPYRRRGADPVLASALALAALTEHLDTLTDAGHAADALLAHVQIVVPTTARALLSVAQLRALRSLTARLAEVWGAAPVPPVTIHAVTDAWDQTRYAPYTNLVRHTIKAAAAVLGGCDTLAVTAHDALDGAGTSEARRLARNVGLLLRHEAHLDAPADPAGGAYYLEVATDRIARGAWDRFRGIERAGGLRAILSDGSLGALLAASATSEQGAVATRRRVLVGTNVYPHAFDVADEATAEPEPSRNRLAEPFERMRARTERHARETGRPATALLLPVGDARMRSARAAFARGIFGSGSFRVVQADAVDDAATLDARVFADAPDVVVACSADDAYESLVAHLARLREESAARSLLVVAGRPAGRVEALAGAGADAFLHAGMDVLTALTRLQDQLGLAR